MRRSASAAITTALLLSAMLWALPSATAGSVADPEITDVGGDHVVGGIPLPLFGGGDLAAGWVHQETATDFVFALQASGDISPTLIESYTFSFFATFNGTEAIATSDENGVAGGAATSALVDADTLFLTVPKTAFGNVTPGQPLTGLRASASGVLLTAPLTLADDDAPDSGSGRDYIVGSQADPGVDFDGDGIDDADELAQGTDPASTDTDGDGLSDGDEINIHGTNATNPDTDGDGASDGDEVAAGSDPVGSTDSDNDGLTDGQEINIYGSDPLQNDTDGDGISDGDEVNIHGTDPTNADSDGDGIPDDLEILHGLDPLDASDADADNDGDGVSNADEIANGTDPNVADQDDGGLFSFMPWDLDDWMWIAILALLLILLLFLIWLILILARRDRDDEEDEDHPEEMDEDETWAAYLHHGLTEEQIEDARRLYEEREERYSQHRQGGAYVPPGAFADDEDCYHPPSIQASNAAKAHPGEHVMPPSHLIDGDEHR